MRIAYLMLVHNNIEFLNRIITKLDDGENKFFIHVDKKSGSIINQIKFTDNIEVISNNYVYWGGFSIVQSTLDLIELAINSGQDFDYFILFSGSDYPIRSQKCLKEFLSRDTSVNYINARSMPNDVHDMERLEYTCIEGGFRNKCINGKLINIRNNIIKILNIKTRLPQFTFYSGSQWWALTKECIKYIDKEAKKNTQFVDFFRKTFAPDEVFFQTIIMNSKYKNKIRPTLTYSDWEIGKPPYPCTIDEDYFDILKNGKQMTKYGEQNIFFARKFDAVKSKNVLMKIDNELIGEEVIKN